MFDRLLKLKIVIDAAICLGFMSGVMGKVEEELDTLGHVTEKTKDSVKESNRRYAEFRKKYDMK